MNNTDIRNEIKEAGLKLWEIAYALGVTDGNFSRRLRRELSDKEKTKIRKVIIEIRKGV